MIQVTTAGNLGFAVLVDGVMEGRPYKTRGEAVKAAIKLKEGN